MALDEWLGELRRAAGDEEADKPATFSLATLGGDGGPRVRTVVSRGIDDGGAVAFVSDRRSDKDDQVRRDGRAEAVFWLERARLQFRLRGRVEVVADDSRQRAAWGGLSDRARSLFFWPPCGERRTEPDAAFVEKVGADAGPPANFEALVLRPDRVDRLDLAGHPHRRRQWSAADGWGGVDVNP